ncbi:restriction endonuclease subunit S [bacterium]|nr:restriction endonuclease subunit S [bacterium]
MSIFLRHDSYKDSGISWIDEIPSHWMVERAKWLFCKMDRPVRPEDDVVTAFRDGQVTLRKNRRTEGFTNALQEHGYQGIRRGDLVIHAMDAFAGAIGVSDSDGKSTPVYSVCVPYGNFPVNAHYYAHLLRYMSRSGYIQSLAKGIRERSTDFRFNDFANLFLPIPSKQEQDQIVAFLDEKTAEIDDAIAKKKRLIELLQEQKAILINRAVTQGLDPNVSMRDSGVAWLGQVPAHWEVKRAKHLSSFITSGPRGWATYYADDGSYFLQSGNLNNSVGIELEKANRVNPPNGAEGKRTKLRNNDVLICVTGANTGRVAIAKIHDNEVYINQHLCLVRSTSQIVPSYLAYCLHSLVGQTYFLLQQYGLKEGLGLDDVKNAPVLVPPISEQIAISSFIENTIAQIDELEISVLKQITKLNEFKATLISDAVTGKIKV